MTATTSSNRFATEKRPPIMASRRDERLKNFHSFDEITESEEEDIQEPTSSNCSTSSERSPYAVYEPVDKSLKTRSFSLTNNPFLSPRIMRHISTPRLSRVLSDPVRRKSSLPTILSEPSDDFLSLPPIPEATTPASPSTNKCNPFINGSK